VSGSGDHTIQLWNIQKLELFCRSCLATRALFFHWHIHPMGLFIASGSSDTSVRIWAATTGLQVAMYAWTCNKNLVCCILCRWCMHSIREHDGKINVWSMHGTLGSEKVFATPRDVIDFGIYEPKPADGHIKRWIYNHLGCGIGFTH